MHAALQVEAHADELPTLNAFLHNFWRDAGLPTQTAFAFELAMEELFLNVVQHGSPPDGRTPRVEIRVTSDTDSRSVHLVFRDDGIAFDPTLLPPPDVTAALESRGVGGLGVHLVRQMMDRVSYRHHGGYNEITLDRRITAR